MTDKTIRVYLSVIPSNNRLRLSLLQYRDYPRLPKFFRHRTAVALISPPSE